MPNMTPASLATRLLALAEAAEATRCSCTFPAGHPDAPHIAYCAECRMTKQLAARGLDEASPTLARFAAAALVALTETAERARALAGSIATDEERTTLFFMAKDLFDKVERALRLAEELERQMEVGK